MSGTWMLHSGEHVHGVRGVMTVLRPARHAFLVRPKRRYVYHRKELLEWVLTR